MGFHQKTFLYFGRTASGDVRIIKFKMIPNYPPKPDKSYHDDDNVLFDCTIPADDWCTQVAQVSHGGDLRGQWDVMKEFHDG